MRRTVRLLHTSDVHIGDVGSAGAGVEALAAVVDTARAARVDVVLIAGDLFDGGYVRGLPVAAALAQLARSPVPVVVIPGNHDHGGENSIYERVDLGSAGDHVWYVGEVAGRSMVLEELGLAVWARGIHEHRPDYRPLSTYARPAGGTWRVAVAHGHYVDDDTRSSRSSPITRGDIEALGCHYVALGHWHHRHDVSSENVAAFYSGSPSQPVSGPATVNIVTLDPLAGVTVEAWALEPATANTA